MAEVGFPGSPKTGLFPMVPNTNACWLHSYLPELHSHPQLSKRVLHKVILSTEPPPEVKITSARNPSDIRARWSASSSVAMPRGMRNRSTFGNLGSKAVRVGTDDFSIDEGFVEVHQLVPRR